jgi:sulfoxide reductase heme-binding subunit YedZ
MTPGSKSFYRITKPLLFLFCMLPLVHLLLRAFQVSGFGLGANPIEELLHELGLWGLKFLLLTLAVTPLRTWFSWPWLTRYRRMLGLFAFFYIVLHFLTYAVLDQGLQLAPVIEDVIKRPYITLGMLGLVLLIPLALTSNRVMMRKLGKRWKTLHRSVYLIAVLGVWHFYWQVKLDTLEALVYAATLAVLLASRAPYFKRSSARRS